MKTEEIDISKKLSGEIHFGLSELKLNSLFEKIDSGIILIQKIERSIIDECQQFQRKRIVIDYVEGADGNPVGSLKEEK